ncbi:MAG: hypothetical protein XXXJIFNMEKO3_02423 [Candidatus Erwinia impunctatus]|nr:hypothetical protein XXXJIFNMEKO_02423 [Culicoides impunctatus]
MDYEFLCGVTGKVQIRMSMGHEAIGQWFNEEVADNPALLEAVIAGAQSVQGSERQWQHIGHEYTLLLDEEEVMVRANILNFSEQEIEEGLCYYDEESLAFCGLTDFLALISAWRDFAQLR